MSNYIKYGVVKPDSPAARLVGMPKVDCLANGSLDRARVLGELGLDPGKPTVIYAPTWSPEGRLIAFQSAHAGRTQIRVVPATGGASEALTAEGNNWAPDWSPNPGE